jgi:exosortase A
MADGAHFETTGSTALAPDRWRLAGIVLAALVVGLLLLFRDEVMAALRVWNSSTAYNHCWLVLPIALWLAWQRKGRFTQLAPEPLPVAALLMLPGALAWLVAERLGIMEGRQLVLIGMVWVAVLAVMGWRVTAAMAAPLSYLVFLVPFGAFSVPLLQKITAWQIDVLLDRLTDIPFYIDELVIEIPAGTFLVAEACAGLRFLIAALAFGALYAYVMFRSPWRRLVVMLLALTVPIVANGFRAFGLVLLGHFQGSAAAVDADHVLYGWVFFSIVILLLILAGLPFREDHADLSPARFPSRPAPARPAMLAAAAVLAAGFAAAGPLAAARLDGGALPPPQAVAPTLTLPQRCTAGPEPATMTCQGTRLAVRLLVFAPHTNWSAVAAERHRAFDGGSDEDVTFQVPTPGALWQGRQVKDVRRITAVAAWLDGAPAGDGVRSRARQAWNALSGGGYGVPVLAVVTLEPEGAGDPRDREILRAMLREQAALVEQATALSRGAR